jgi:tryptophanyl-tRNA synthetase
VFRLYSLLASPEQTAEMRGLYLAGGYGYGHAKKALMELIITKFSEERRRYAYYMENVPELEQKLLEGAAKAREVGSEVLARVRKRMGYR